MYIIIAIRMISGLVLKYRKELRWVMPMSQTTRSLS